MYNFFHFPPHPRMNALRVERDKHEVDGDGGDQGEEPRDGGELNGCVCVCGLCMLCVCGVCVCVCVWCVCICLHLTEFFSIITRWAF